MKLDHLLSGLSGLPLIVTFAALATGCSATTAQTPTNTGALHGTSVTAADAARVSDAVAITHLMSAQLPGPAPRVGKSHLASDDDALSGSEAGSEAATIGSDNASETDGESAPKTIRRSDGSRRHGGFGTTK